MTNENEPKMLTLSEQAMKSIMLAFQRVLAFASTASEDEEVHEDMGTLMAEMRLYEIEGRLYVDNPVVFDYGDFLSRRAAVTTAMKHILPR